MQKTHYLFSYDKESGERAENKSPYSSCDLFSVKQTINLPA